MATRTFEEVKAAISQHLLEERAELAAELCGWAGDDWDRQMKADAEAGKFILIKREAKAAHTASQTIPLEEILREP